MAGLKERVGRRMPARADALRELTERVERLEAENIELRRHGMRLAEVVDLVQELLVPVATRDEKSVEEAVEAFRRSL